MLVNQRLTFANEYMNSILTDTYQPAGQHDDDDCAGGNNSNDVSFENFYDAQPADEAAPVELQKISTDPTERLIEAIEGLREVLVENTNAQKGARRGRTSGGQQKGGGGHGGGHGAGQSSCQKSDNERLKVRTEKESSNYDIYGLEPIARKVIVELRVVFLKIGEIDTLKEQYNADVFVQAKWREPKLDGKSAEELKNIELERYWNPLLYIDNIITETKDSCWLTAVVNSRGETFVMERRRTKGIFLENLELNDFPLDVQDLTLTMTTERPDNEIDIIPDENEMSGINITTFVDQQEWRLHEHIEVTRRVMTQEFSSSSRNHPALSVTCRAARRPGYFYWNVFLVMFLISGLSFATFAVRPDLPQKRLQLAFTLLLTSVTFKYVINQSLPKISYLTYMFFISGLSFATFAVDVMRPQNRLHLSFTLVLTAVAFKFVITQSLPKISYLTYMDKYVLMSLVILCIVCIWHAVVTVFIKEQPTEDDKKFVNTLERDVFIAFAVMYIVCHIIFIFWLYFDACKRRRLMKQKDREFRDFLAKRKEWQAKTKELSARRTSTVPLHAAIYDR